MGIGSVVAVLAALSSTPSPAPATQRTYVGVYLNDVSGFDVKEGRFRADLQLWCKWAGDATPPAIELLNGEIESREEVARESDGNWHGVRWRVQGTFRGTFPLHRFPFDTQELTIQIVAPPSAGELVPDLAGSGMEESFSITGWIYEPWFHANTVTRRLGSDLGAVAREGTPHEDQVVTFGVELERPFIAYAVKFILPLSVILAMGCLAVLLPGDRIDVRSGIGVTVLLACVAFHFSQSDSLPEVPYLVLADKLFLGSYALIFIMFTVSIVAYLLFQTDPRLSRKIDLVTFIGIPAIGLVLIVWEVNRPAPEPVPVASANASASPAPSATPTPPSREVLRVGALSLGGVVSSLTRRGLAPLQPDGSRAAHLVDVVPSMTNDRVRLLPDGGMRVRWRLRKGLKWSDGTPISTGDLVFSLTTLENPDRIAVEVKDARTIDVRYRNRLAEHLLPFNVVPKHVMEPGFTTREVMFKRVSTEIVPGDGPYRTVALTPDVSAAFERNPHFPGAPATFARIEVKEFSDSEASAAALRAGEIDFIPTISINGIEKVRGDANVVLRQQLGEILIFLQPDLGAPPFDDVRVRRAIALAVNRTAIAKTLYGDQGIPSTNYRAPTDSDVEPDVPAIPFDPAAARKTLVATGLHIPIPLTFTHIELKEGTPGALAVFAIVKDLEAAGFAVKRVPVKSSQEAHRTGKHGGLLYYNRAADGSIAPYWNVPYANGGYRTEKTNAVFDAAVKAELDRHGATLFDERRTVISKRLQKMFAERLPVIPIALGSRTTAAHVKLSGPAAPGEASSWWWNVETWTMP